MHTRDVRLRAIGLHQAGVSTRQISLVLGVSRAALKDWFADPVSAGTKRVDTCFVCAGIPCPVQGPYCYLLGQYLGDGYLVTSTRVPRLRVACADDYPVIAARVDAALRAVRGKNPGYVQQRGCTDRYSYWMHWPCLFPQHGPGRKHERPIRLTTWQQRLVDADPWPLIRGLIDSDGCRALNRVVVRGKTYTYSRYFFSNESRDILGIAAAALDAAGVEWRFNRPNCISVARRASVALMDEHVGPKR